MTRKERNDIIKWANTLTDEQLKDEYYDAVYGSLGSVAERMYDLGYDIADIREQEENEKFENERCDVLESLCYMRGIKLWESEENVSV